AIPAALHRELADLPPRPRSHSSAADPRRGGHERALLSVGGGLRRPEPTGPGGHLRPVRGRGPLRGALEGRQPGRVPHPGAEFLREASLPTTRRRIVPCLPTSHLLKSPEEVVRDARAAIRRMPTILKIDTFRLVVPAGVMTGTRWERYHGSGGTSRWRSPWTSGS